MPEGDELKKRNNETETKYIARLRKRLRELCLQHGEENESMPQFASEIEDLTEREKWEATQLAQWNARHEILRVITDMGKYNWEEFSRGGAGYDLERRQRWLTPEGKEFLAAIIDGLQKKENLWNDKRYQAGLNFGEVTIYSGKKFADFYYVHHEKSRRYRDLLWADLQGKILPRANLQEAELFQSNLRGAHLEDANLQKAHLGCANLQRANLYGANLQRANFYDANLQGAVLQSANLQEAWLPNANLQEADLRKADLQRTNLEEAKLQKAVLDGANLQGANLRQTNLRRADLRKANLQRANLEEANLQEANLFGSDLVQANVQGASLKNVKLKDVASLSQILYSPEWRGPLWIGFIFSLISFLVVSPYYLWMVIRRRYSWNKRPWKLFYWKREHRIRSWIAQHSPIFISIVAGVVAAVFRFICKGGEATFHDINYADIDFSSNPVLKQYIEDENYVRCFAKIHPTAYWFWARFANCGRSIGLWAFWCVVAILLFAGLYFIPGLVEITDTRVPAGLLGNIYSSLLTFATFGFGSVTPASGWGAVVVGVEVILGYIFFGGLIALFTSTLTRRA